MTEDCSERCTCARSGVLLCEPLSCRAGEICTLANLTRGCFRGEPRPLWCCPRMWAGVVVDAVSCARDPCRHVRKLDHLIPLFPPFSGGSEGVNSCFLSGTGLGLFLALAPYALPSPWLRVSF